jgi:hypothetical protein
LYAKADIGKMAVMAQRSDVRFQGFTAKILIPRCALVTRGGWGCARQETGALDVG